MPPIIHLCRDLTAQLDLTEIADGLNSICRHLRFEVGAELIDIPGDHVVCPDTYHGLPRELSILAASRLRVVVFTEKRYANNYFFQTSSNIVIVSGADWEDLTSLPRNNGAIRALASILSEMIQSGPDHDQNTGCIYDYLWDKRGIDFGMRAATICNGCRSAIELHSKGEHARAVLDDLLAMLDELAAASKRNQDVVERFASAKASREKIAPVDPEITTAGQPEHFDVFLCHNVADKPDVRRIAVRLREMGLRPWLDEEQIRPGLTWQTVLEVQIASVNAAAVAVGPNGIGPWHSHELMAFIQEFVRRQCPVIPVMLVGTPDNVLLPILLRNFTFVDFRCATPDPWDQLYWGITGRRSPAL